MFILDKIVGWVDSIFDASDSSDSSSVVPQQPNQGPYIEEIKSSEENHNQPAKIEDIHPDIPWEIFTEEIKDFIVQFIVPDIRVFRRRSLLSGTIEILKILEQKGSCPSVVLTLIKSDEESKDVTSIRDLLSQISLKDHTLRVTRYMIKFISEEHHGRVDQSAIIVGLSHDLGKIPELRNDAILKYAEGDHPLISARVVSEIFSNHPYNLEFIFNAIESHHRPTRKNESNYFLTYLKRADQAARSEELARLIDNANAKWGELFLPREYLNTLSPHMNIMRGNKCDIFCYKSTVYASPNFLFNQARLYAKEKHIVDLTVLNIYDKPIALKRIIESLRTVGAVSAELPTGYYGMQYIIDVGRFSFKMFLTPIKIEFFPNMPSYYDSRKIGWLKIIKSIKRSK
ncbi:MAG: HD domain-containing protein [Pseudomonadota bacterium]|nr:HD domain-containing protein [Pseudomonadota bacterium]